MTLIYYSHPFYYYCYAW